MTQDHLPSEVALPAMLIRVYGLRVHLIRSLNYGILLLVPDEKLAQKR